MTDTVVEKAEQPSFLGMSDEEMMNAPPPVIKAVEAVVTPVVETPVVVAEVAKTGGALDQDDEDVEGENTGGAVGGTPASKPVVEAETTPKEPVAEDTPKDPVIPVKDAPVVDYEAEYKRLLAPFKANGRDIKVDTVDDAVALMQMGANYNKKMAALKPNLKLMKMLENNGFLSEDKISYLIDLGKHNPAAINKLVKDSAVDPMDLDAEKASAYKQTAYAVDDREIELDTVLDELQGTPTYTRTLDVVSNKWDVASKRAVSQAPQLLKVLNDHVANGIYDLISTEIEREKLFGRLNGLSDLEAYRQTGDALQARGGFNHLNKVQTKTPPVAPEIVQPKPKAVVDDKLNDKRRAASSTKAVVSGLVDTDYNPLSLSDEDFGKLVKPRIL